MTMSQIEDQRSSLEELEVIESAIADRIQRNPSIYVGSTANVDHGILNTNKKRPLKEVLIQRNEIDLFVKRYKRICLELQSQIQSASTRAAIESLKDAKFEFKSFDEMFSQLKKTHSESLSGKAETISSLYEIGSANFESQQQQNQQQQQQQQQQIVPSLPNIPIAPHQNNNSNNNNNDSTSGQLQQTRKTILSKFASGFKIDSTFSLEEQYGKFLDLIKFHESWLNLPGLSDASRANYLQYLNIFSKLGLKYLQDENNPNSSLKRETQEYFAYVRDLADYLVGFLQRTQVLSGPERIIYKIKQVDFEREWASLLEKYINKSNSAVEEASGGALFCKACKKSFAKQSVFDGHLKGKKHIKNEKRLAESGDLATTDADINDSNSKNIEREKELSLNEFLIRSLAQFLEKQIKDTRLNVERKQALTNKERIEETKQLLSQIDNEDFPPDDDDDDDGHTGTSGFNGNGNDHSDDENNGDVANPLKLPLDLDGKPIPYWLWKLQGLDHEYQCEICGNFKYAGRKIYDKHFMEQRHIYGLKCLGIQINPNNQGNGNSSSGGAGNGNSDNISSSEIMLAFKGITQIEEATKLWSKLKKDLRMKGASGNENIIEVEDEEGNVMSVKVYEDLKKQGLI